MNTPFRPASGPRFFPRLLTYLLLLGMAACSEESPDTRLVLNAPGTITFRLATPEGEHEIFVRQAFARAGPHMFTIPILFKDAGHSVTLTLSLFLPYPDIAFGYAYPIVSGAQVQRGEKPGAIARLSIDGTTHFMSHAGTLLLDKAGTKIVNDTRFRVLSGSFAAELHNVDNPAERYSIRAGHFHDVLLIE